MKLKYYYNRFIDTLKYYQIGVINRRISPVERDSEFDELVIKVQKKADRLANEQLKQLNEIEKSYEYISKQHLAKTEYLNKSKTDLLKNTDFEFLNKGELWEYNYNNSLLKRLKFSNFHYYYDDYSKYEFKRYEKLLLFAIGLFIFKLGYSNGYIDSDILDEVKYSVNDIRNEDDIFDILMTTNKPTVVLYYYPGDYRSISMQLIMGKLAQKYSEIPREKEGNNSNDFSDIKELVNYKEYFNLAKVNCKYNLDLCMKKANYINFPQWELMYPPINEVNNETKKTIKKFPIVPCTNERSFEGLEGFLMSQNVIEDKYNPLIFSSKAAVRLENI